MSSQSHPTLLKLQSPSAARWLFALGFLAMVLHTLANMGWMSNHGGQSSRQGNSSLFVAEICTSLGVGIAPSNVSVSIGDDAANVNDSSDSTPANPAPSLHNCCNLCVAGGAMLLASQVFGVLPTPTFQTTLPVVASAHRVTFIDKAHPPRAPPSLT
jgi:hypothetical protein